LQSISQRNFILKLKNTCLIKKLQNKVYSPAFTQLFWSLEGKGGKFHSHNELITRFLSNYVAIVFLLLGGSVSIDVIRSSVSSWLLDIYKDWFDGVAWELIKG